MALTPERIKELQGYAGGSQAQPSMPQPNVPQPTQRVQNTAPITGKMDAFGQGMDDQARAIRNIPVLKQGLDFGTQVGVGVGQFGTGFLGMTTKLASDFSSKHLGDDNGITKYLSNQAQNAQYLKDNLYKSENIGNTEESISGQVGKAVGTMAGYYYGGKLLRGASPLRSMAGFGKTILADTALGTAQTGDITEGSKVGLVSALTGGLSNFNAARQALKGNVAQTVLKPKTIMGAVKSTFASGLRETGEGYVGDVGSGLAGQRGEDKTGMNAFKPGLQSVIGGTVGVGAVSNLPRAGQAIKDVIKPSNAALEKKVVQQFEKGVKPLLNARSTPAQVTKYKSNIVEATKVINDNKLNLSYTDDVGDTIVGKTPRSLQQLSDAVDQTKKTVYSEYNALTKQSGEKGLVIKTNSVADELDTVIANEALQISNPTAVQYAQDLKDRLSYRELTPEITENVIKNYNESLKAFYRNPSYEAASKASIDALIVNKLREQLDNGITSLTGVRYQVLKNKYGALKTIENDVLKAALRDARKANKGLLDFTDIFSGADIVSGVLSMNPAQFARGVGGRGIKEFYKYLNSPNRAVKKMFDSTEKLNQRSIPKIDATKSPTTVSEKSLLQTAPSTNIPAIPKSIDIPPTVPPIKPKSKSLLKTIKDTPNKQGGFAKNPFVKKSDALGDSLKKDMKKTDEFYPDAIKVKNIHPAEVETISNFVDAHHLKEVFSEADTNKLYPILEREGISPDLPQGTIVRKLEMILDGTTPSKGTYVDPDSVVDLKKGVEFKVTQKDASAGTEYMDIIVDGKRIGELETLKGYYGADDLHIQFIGLDDVAQGKGFAQEAINKIIRQNKGIKTISAEPTNKKAYKALKKALGEPEEISTDIRNLTEEELLDSIPDTAQYLDNGDLDSTARGLVTWKVKKQSSINTKKGNTDSSPNQALIQEAKKYKTVEEYVFKTLPESDIKNIIKDGLKSGKSGTDGAGTYFAVKESDLPKWMKRGDVQIRINKETVNRFGGLKDLKDGEVKLPHTDLGIPAKVIQIKTPEGKWVQLEEIYKKANAKSPTLLQKIKDTPNKQGGFVSTGIGNKERLVATHNISIEKLLKANKQGGLTNPSMAIFDSDHGFSSFGEISLLGNKNLISKGKTFASDVYSPRYPNVETVAKDMKPIENILKKYEKETGDFVYNIDKDNIVSSLEESTLSKAAFLDSKNIKIPKVLDKKGDVDYYDTKRAIRELINNKNLNSEYLKYSKNITELGNVSERIWVGTDNMGRNKYLPNTIENASKVMNRADIRGGENFGFAGLGGIRARFVKELKSLKQIKDSKGLIKSTTEFKKSKEIYENTFNDIMQSLSKYEKSTERNSFIKSDYQRNALTEYLDGDKKALDWQYSKIPESELRVLENFKDDLKNMPTEYFETKFKKPVKINEFNHAVIPNSTPKEVLDILKENNIPYTKYETGNDSARIKIIKQLRDDKQIDTFGKTKVNMLLVGAAAGVGAVAVKQELDKKRKLLKK